MVVKRGNTEKVAQAMGAALGGEVRRVTEVTPEQLAGLDALIVGSPTQKFQPLKPILVNSSRRRVAS